MARYVDLYVLPVPKKSIPAYRRMSSKMGRIMRSMGATEYREFLGEDLVSKMGMRSPLTLVKVRKGDVLVFAVVGFRSKSERNRIQKGIMKDPRVKKMCEQPMPFDMKRMVYGGFTTIVKA